MKWGNGKIFLPRENQKNSKFIIFFVFALIFLASLLIMVTLVPDNAEATYGLQVSVRAPADKWMDAMTNPQSINFTIDVENVGTQMENITITVTFDDPGKPAAGWTVNPNNFTLNNMEAGITETREVIVTAPVDAPYPSFAQLAVAGHVQEDPGTTSQDNFIARVSQILDVDVSPSGPSLKSADPGESISFIFDVQNNGSSSDNYNILVDNVTTETSGDTGLWFSEISFNPTSIINLAKGGIVSVTMDVNVPNPADLYLIPTGLYNLSVEVSSATDSNVKDTLIFVVDVQQIYWADIQDSVTTKQVDVGASVQYSITIKNMGNDFDYLTVEIEGDPAIPGSQNWGRLTHSPTGQIDQSALVDIDLNAGSSTIIELEITIPDRTDPEYPSFDPDTVTLKLIVKPSDEMGIEDEVNVTADINPIYDFNFVFLAETVDVNLGDIAVFTMKIENKGTTSETFTYEVYQWLVSDWSAYGYTFTPSSITIAANDIGDVTFSLNTPSSPEEGPSQDYGITIKVHSQTSDMDLFKNCTVFIEPFYDVNLTLTDSPAKSVDVGNSVTYSFKIKNIGNVYDVIQYNVIDLDTTPSGGGDQSSWVTLYWEGSPGTPVTSDDLDYGDIRLMIMEISVPDQGDPNFAELSSPLDIVVEATSIYEPTASDSLTTSTTVNPIYSFQFTTTAPANTKYGLPGEIVQFSFQIRNTGTITDSYNFIITSIDDSIFTMADPNNIVDLGVDNYGTSLAQINITADCEKALVGMYDIGILARSIGDSSVTHSITIHIDIDTKAALDLEPTSQTNSGDPEDIIDYIILVKNMGNDQDVFDLTLEGTYKEWGEILNLLGGPISQVTLTATGTPGYMINVILRVTIPGQGETSAQQTYPVDLKVTSTNDGSVSKTARCSTTVNGFVDLEILYVGTGNATKDYDPNQKAPLFSFRVYNNGNQYEDSIEIRIDDIDADWDYSPTNLEESLDPGSLATFSLELFIPPNESEGEYQMDVYIVSGVDPSYQSIPVTITLNVIKPDLSISSADISGLDDLDFLKGKVGNAVTISANIHNVGTSEAKNIQVKLYEDSTLKGTKSISSIVPGGSRIVDFRWTVVSDMVEIKIEITPQEETDEGNNEISPILLDLRPDLSFSGEKIVFSNSNPYLDETITITAYIFNGGGDAEDVIMNFYEGSTLIGKRTIDIDFNDVKGSSINWNVPNKPGEQLLIVAEIEHPDSLGHGDITSKPIVLQNISTISIEPELELVGNLVATEGESFYYTVIIENYDPARTYTFSDDSTLFDIDPSTGNISFKPSKSDAGTHIVTITVTDNNGNTDSSIATFRILEAEEEEQESFEIIWILLIIITAVIVFIVGYFVGGKKKGSPPEEEIPDDNMEPEQSLPPPPPLPENPMENK